MSSKFKLIMLAALSITLSGCGEGWEQIRSEAFPYGGQRTAGTGVAYVRAVLMPERELNLKPLHLPESQDSSYIEKGSDKTEVLDELRQMFRKKQEK